MDVHDVSALPQFFQLLLKQKQSLLDAQSRKGQHPKGRKARDHIALQFRLRLMMKQNTNHFNIQTSFIPPTYRPCTTPFSALSQVMIDDLVLETHHRGSYLVLRSITPPDRMNSIMTIVEDENRDAIMLQLYYQDEENVRPANEILEEGAVLMVKEPFFKLMSDGDYGLRIDHLSDIIHLPMYDERVPECWQLRYMKHGLSASNWKTKGNDYFKMNKYHHAIENYTTALNCSPTVEETQTIKLNRSLAFLRTMQFDASLSDLEFLSTASKPLEKALFRKSQALYSLRRYRECCEVLKCLRIEYPNSVEAKAKLTQAISRLVEQENGKYQFKQFYTEASRLRPPHLDHATYIGPVSVRASGSRGRGLFTTRAVEAGDLLFCEKAFAHAFIDTENEENTGKMTALIIPETDSVVLGAQAELLRDIVQKLSRNPSLAPAITDLHHGSYNSVSVSEIDGTPVVDTFLVQRVISLNCFGCPLSTHTFHFRDTEDVVTQRTDKEEHFHSCGIWPMASYINHCCYNNAARSFIGDMMVVRATRNLAPDTEVTFWYQMPVADDYDECQRKFKPWAFECDCAMCHDAQTTEKSILEERKRLKAKLSEHLQSDMKANSARIATIIAAMADTYRRPAFEVPRLSLWASQLALARIYWLQKQPVKVIDSGLEVLACLGYVIEGGKLPRTSGTPIVVKQWGLMVESLIECWMLLSGSYRLVAPDLEMQAEEYARISYRIYIGEDETYDETYGKLAK